jgi:hypothetical protein
MIRTLTVEIAFVRKIESPIFPFLANRGLSRRGRGAPLEMTGELSQAVHNRPAGRSASGLQSPGSAPIKKKKMGPSLEETTVPVQHLVPVTLYG